ncbi:hypothetical protein [Nannocystis punicea]|uniref:Secreted protein n=1 Tax=Nannocystis punicea TaxID=2995304 RepID=A0ABY7H1T2_9BACT|nr:hypothetical protein [Nannocystis poenicansa]WAS93207.1 hypothetical protein O0S08_44150 [Nannocystis poenicansa]
MHHANKILIVLALVVGCDQQQFLKKEIAAVAAVKDRSAAAPVVVAPKTAAAVAKASDPSAFFSLSDCLGSCDGVNTPTDRTTCRLNCETAYGAEARGAVQAADDDAIAQVTGCLGRCGGSHDREACAESCKTTAAQSAAAPSTEVLTQLDACVKLCHVDKGVRATDQATCELNCAQVARVEATPPPSAVAGAPAS